MPRGEEGGGGGGDKEVHGVKHTVTGEQTLGGEHAVQDADVVL